MTDESTRVPQSTYRFQVTPDFDLHAAAGRLSYLHDLGVDWVYLSPLLASEPGSQHGYDVVAFDHVDPERGGEEGLAALSAEARRLGMGVLVDIVPNHVGVATPSEDPWWWDVLRLGRESEHASAFDVDWSAGDGRIVIPVIGDDDEAAVAHAGLQALDDEVRRLEAFWVPFEGAQAPVVMDVPLVLPLDALKLMPLRELQLLRPEKHAFVPVNCARRHVGIAPTESDRS